MTSSAILTLSDLGTPPVSEPTHRRLTTPGETNAGAPCLGLAILAAGALWAGLGSAVTLLLFVA
jgi:hypothetical protein